MKKKVNNFSFQHYKTIRIRNDFFFKLLIVNNSLIKKSFVKNFCQNKIRKKNLIQFFNLSVFKNFESITTGDIFFIKPNNKNNNLSKSKKILEKKIFNFFNDILIIKLNKRIYFSKAFLKSNFLTYNENILLFFQLKLVQIKKVLKKLEESRI